MVTIEESDDERSIVTPAFRLRFQRQSDRWCHAIELRTGGGWQVFARSVESGAEQTQPMMSPTYQELVIQIEEGSVVALLVGSSGAHHYSASMRVTCTADDPRLVEFASLRIDVADRCRSETGALASTYSVQPPAGSCRGEGSMPSWGMVDDDGRDRLVLFGRASPVEKETSTLPTVTILAEANGDFQVQASAAVTPATATQRLVYVWAVGRNPR